MKIPICFALSACLSAPTFASLTPCFDPPERRVYVVGTAHLDTQWLWTIQDTIKTCLADTLRVNLDAFKKYPDYVFSFEGAFRYMLMKEYYPEQFAQVKQRVKEGRWRVTGSWVDAVDTNVPSPESLIRHTLYGNGYFEREFGKRSVDVFLPDCFGFGYALPSIAAHSGLKGFSTQKLTWGSAVGIPFNIGTWEGVDGSSIVAALDPGSYVGDVGSDWNKADWLMGRINGLGEKSGLYADYRYHGTGDRGGGPSQRSLENLQSTIKAGGPIKVFSTGADQLYRDITPAQFAKLPHYKGELLLKTHGTGCYTSQAAVKHWNRKNELLADAAERAAAMADILSLGSASYPKAKLNQAWVRFLWHQFHDDLTGTSIPQVYTFTWNDQLLSLNQFAEVLQDSIRTAASALDTRAQGIPVVVYNPLAIARRDPVEATLSFGKNAPRFVRVFGPDGVEVPSQLVRTEGGSATVAFVASAPGVGMAVYDVRPSATPCAIKTGLNSDARSIENSRYRVRVDANGDISSVFDKVLSTELLKSPMRLALLADRSRSWPAWEVTYAAVAAEPREYVAGPVKIEVVEQGPARVAMRVERPAAGSTFVQTISLAAGSSRVEVDTRVDWRTKGTLLKAVFPCTTGNPKATYDIGLGTVQRGNDRPDLYEVPAQQWADLTDLKGTAGISILSESKYGWDKPDDDTLRLTLIHTPDPGRGYNAQASNDLGHHHFAYAVYAHHGDWRNGTAAEAARLNQPLMAFQTQPSQGALGRKLSILEAKTPGILVRAFKKQESGNMWVVRVFETSGNGQKNARIRFPKVPGNVFELNGAEEWLSKPTARMEITVAGDLVFDMKPYRPRTFAVELDWNMEAAQPTSISRALKLPLDAQVVSARGRKGGAMDAKGSSIPSELWPQAINGEGVKYRLGPAAGKNALVCRGQKVAFESQPTRVYVLAASTDGDVPATFKIGVKSVKAVVPYYSGFIGQWDSRLPNGKFTDDPTKMAPAYVKRTPVAWVGTHRHDRDGKDEPYVFCYLFKLAFDVPEGAASLTLPNDPRIRVFAVSTAWDQRPATIPAQRLYE